LSVLGCDLCGTSGCTLLLLDPEQLSSELDSKAIHDLALLPLTRSKPEGNPLPSSFTVSVNWVPASSSSVMETLLAYTRALFAQVLQSVACNAAHSVEQRYARWLLITNDRAEADTFELTQEFLAVMLSVRRATVNGVGNAFQKRGLIRYSRGKITILDRAGLEAVSCDCYGIVRRGSNSFSLIRSTKKTDRPRDA
jgi:hypothetical protein